MPEMARAREMLEDADLIFGTEEVQASIRRMGEEISLQLRDSHPLVLAVMRGGIFLCGQLLPHLRFPMDLDYVHATRYGPGTTGGRIEWKVRPTTAVSGRDVLLVDDILDEGLTLAAISDEIRALGARRCLAAVLVEKDLGRVKPFAADFVGLRVPDRFVFGCGMDAHGQWRNLGEIYALKEA